MKQNGAPINLGGPWPVTPDFYFVVVFFVVFLFLFGFTPVPRHAGHDRSGSLGC